MKCFTLVLALCGSAAGAGTPGGDRALIEAARRGDAARVEALVREGANVNAATSSGLTPLIEAAARGRTVIARRLIDAGADLDARHRELGTALDAAERNGHRDIARILKERGARGSGKSVGDTVCVRGWSGSGFCGVIQDRTATGYRLDVRHLQGCPNGCLPDDDCSDGRRVGGRDRDRVRVGAEVWVRSWCLTDTGLPAER